MRLVSLLICLSSAFAKVVDFEKDGGAKAGDYSWDTVWKNGAALNTSLQSLKPGDTFVVPNKTFAIMGGIKVQGLKSVTIQIDGTIEFASTALNAEKYLKEWPRNKNGGVHECLQFDNLNDLKFTSTNIGMLNGAGAKWWGIPGIGYITRKENRPRLLKIQNSKRILIEKLFLKDSPYWTFLGSGIKGLEVRHSQIDARRDSSDSHDIVDLTAFNTDGFDLGSCDDVWIHDCSVWNQDDCFDVKDGTSNVVIERVNASGLGLTVGSIASTVRNLTFRDSYMHHTYKGIYMKFRGDGLIADVTYENIVMDAPEQWAIWIGPAQQCDGCSATNICSTDGGPCSICWPTFPGSQCHAPPGGKYVNITLRNITINNPKGSPGVLLANTSVPMENVVFDNVVVNNPGKKPWGDKYYHCENVNGVATGKTWPVPPCFHDLTSSNASGNAHGSSQA